MTDSKQTNTDAAVATPFSSNAMRLSLRDWVLVTAILLLAMILTPMVWKSLEPFAPSPDFRVPYDLSDDY